MTFPSCFLRKYGSPLFSIPFYYLVYLSFHLTLLYFLYIVNLYSACN